MMPFWEALRDPEKLDDLIEAGMYLCIIGVER